jgi:hypothetical protein
MTFEEILDQAAAMLERRGRLTYRALQYQFKLDEEGLEARTSVEQALVRYDPERCRSPVSLYGIDPGILCCSCLSWVLQWLGYPD